MNQIESIESAELRFMQILEDFFISVYDEKNLPSHGINHHRRVWQNAKEIIRLPDDVNILKLSCNTSKLIIACYMHDIGMYADPGPRHGKKSRELCIQFIKMHNLQKNDYDDLLDTIENHDNKTYSAGSPASNLFRILSIADDLDAFGFTGIYRYAEIYLTRGICPEKTGSLILENASVRFRNFISAFPSGSQYVKKHRKRFEILENFFLNFNNQADSYIFGANTPNGYCGVIDLIMSMVRNKLTITGFFEQHAHYGNDEIIASFLNGLKSELIPEN